jgi:hypothetical protein
MKSPSLTALRAEAQINAKLSRARESLAAAEESLALFEERSVLEVRLARCRAEVAMIEQEHAAYRTRIWGPA